MASQMTPQGCARTGGLASWGRPRRSQDRLGSVLFSSCRSGSLFWSSWAPLGVIFGRLGLLLGSYLAAPGVVLVLFRHFNSSIQPVNSSTRRINSSTHQPMALRHFLTRPGGLRAARLNKLSEVAVPNVLASSCRFRIFDPKLGFHVKFRF